MLLPWHQHVTTCMDCRQSGKLSWVLCIELLLRLYYTNVIDWLIDCQLSWFQSPVSGPFGNDPKQLPISLVFLVWREPQPKTLQVCLALTLSHIVRLPNDPKPLSDMTLQELRHYLPEAEVKGQNFLHKVKFFTVHLHFLISLWFGAFISMVNIFTVVLTMLLGILKVKGDLYNKLEIKKANL